MSKRTVVVTTAVGQRRTAHITYDHHHDGDTDVALCSERVWRPRISGVTVDFICSECLRLDSPPERKTPDPKPSISIQHRCSRMGEHVAGSWRGTGKPGSDPGDLPVPCPDCYSIVVTSVAIPWQPNTSRSIP